MCNRLSDFQLVTGWAGQLDIAFDGRLVLPRHEVGRFSTNDEVAGLAL
jgi:hypothetical protein